MMLVAALAVVSAGGLVFALWNVRRMLALRQAEEGRWAALDDRTDLWP